MNIAFVSARCPYPPVKGDQLILWNRLTRLANRHRLTLILLCAERSIEPPALEQVRRICHVVFATPSLLDRGVALLRAAMTGGPLQQALFVTRGTRRIIEQTLAQQGADVVDFMLLRSWGEEIHIPQGCTVSLDLVDSLALNAREIERIAPWWKRPLLRLEAGRLRRAEAQSVTQVDVVIVVAEQDRHEIASSRVEVIPNGVDLDRFRPSDDPLPNVVGFSGNMAYAPNVRAVQWFLPVFQRMRETNPDLEFWIIGASPSRSVRAMAEVPGVRVTGFVNDIGAELARCSVAVVPIFHGSGMQNKLLEAMACGRPVIVSDKAAQPFGALIRDACVVRQDREGFFQALQGIFSHPHERRRLGQAARAFVEAHYSWDRSVASFERTITQAHSRRSS